MSLHRKLCDDVAGVAGLVDGGDVDDGLRNCRWMLRSLGRNHNTAGMRYFSNWLAY